MRRFILALVFALSTSTSYAQTVIAETPNGWLAIGGNETTDGAKDADPAKFRLTTPMDETGGGGGVLSFNANRYFGRINFGGDQREMGMIRVEQSDTVRGQVNNLKAEINFMLNDGSGDGDSAMRKPLAFTWNQVTRFEPALAASFAYHIAPYLPGGTEQRPPFKMVSEDGHYELTIQSVDGNFVTYDLWHQPAPCAIWSSFTGRLPCAN